MKVRFVRAVYFVWIIVPLMILLAWQMAGLPHVIWSYDFLNEGQGFDPFAPRTYTRCTYIGPYGAFTDYSPRGGACAWFRFYHESSAARAAQPSHETANRNPARNPRRGR